MTVCNKVTLLCNQQCYQLLTVYLFSSTASKEMKDLQVGQLKPVRTKVLFFLIGKVVF